MVKSIFIEPNKNSRNVVKEPAEKYNWTNLTRSATDEEFEQTNSLPINFMLSIILLLNILMLFMVKQFVEILNLKS